MLQAIYKKSAYCHYYLDGFSGDLILRSNDFTLTVLGTPPPGLIVRSKLLTFTIGIFLAIKKGLYNFSIFSHISCRFNTEVSRSFICHSKRDFTLSFQIFFSCMFMNTLIPCLISNNKPHFLLQAN